MEQIGQVLAGTAMSGLPSEPVSPHDREQAKVDSLNALVGTLNEEDGYDCPFCKNRGYIAELRHLDYCGGLWQETLVTCKCEKVRKGIRRLQRSGLKDVVRKYRFDTYQATETWQKAVKGKAQAFTLDNEARCFFMGGQSGCGKTHLCTAIAVHYIRQGQSVRYMLWREEVPHLKALVNEPEEYAKLMQELKSADVLYIDDLFKTGRGADGSTNPTGADINLAFEIINNRYNSGTGITIISSERIMRELLAIDEAVAGRIAEMAGGYCLNISRGAGKNWRTRNMVEL